MGGAIENVEESAQFVMQAYGRGDFETVQKKLNTFSPALMQYAGERSREIAAEFVKKKDYKNALIQYDAALVALKPDDKIGLQKIFANRSFCHCQLQNFPQALEQAKRAIHTNPKWSKGWYRAGKALMGEGRNEDAYKVLKVALTNETETGLLEEIQGLADQAESLYKKDKLVARVSTDYKRFEDIGSETAQADSNPESSNVIEFNEDVPEEQRRSIEAMLLGTTTPQAQPRAETIVTKFKPGAHDKNFAASAKSDEVSMALANFMQLASETLVPKKVIEMLKAFDEGSLWYDRLAFFVERMVASKNGELKILFEGTGNGLGLVTASKVLAKKSPNKFALPSQQKGGKSRAEKGGGCGAEKQRESRPDNEMGFSAEEGETCRAEIEGESKKGPKPPKMEPHLLPHLRPIIACTRHPANSLGLAAKMMLAMNSEDSDCRAKDSPHKPVSDLNEYVGLFSRSVEGMKVGGGDELDEALCELDKKADILVIDPEAFDEGLIGSRILPAIRYAKTHLLTPQAQIFPNRVSVYAVLLSIKPVYEETALLDWEAVEKYRWFPNLENVDIFSEGKHKRIEYLSRPILISHFDFSASAENLDQKLALEANKDFTVEVSEPGRLTGIGLSYRIYDSDDSCLGSSGHGGCSSFWESWRLVQSLSKKGGFSEAREQSLDKLLAEKNYVRNLLEGFIGENPSPNLDKKLTGILKLETQKAFSESLSGRIVRYILDYMRNIIFYQTPKILQLHLLQDNQPNFFNKREHKTDSENDAENTPHKNTNILTQSSIEGWVSSVTNSLLGQLGTLPIQESLTEFLQKLREIDSLLDPQSPHQMAGNRADHQNHKHTLTSDYYQFDEKDLPAKFGKSEGFIADHAAAFTETVRKLLEETKCFSQVHKVQKTFSDSNFEKYFETLSELFANEFGGSRESYKEIFEEINIGGENEEAKIKGGRRKKGKNEISECVERVLKNSKLRQAKIAQVNFEALLRGISGGLVGAVGVFGKSVVDEGDNCEDIEQNVEKAVRNLKKIATIAENCLKPRQIDPYVELFKMHQLFKVIAVDLACVLGELVCQALDLAVGLIGEGNAQGRSEASSESGYYLKRDGKEKKMNEGDLGIAKKSDASPGEGEKTAGEIVAEYDEIYKNFENFCGSGAKIHNGAVQWMDPLQLEKHQTITLNVSHTSTRYFFKITEPVENPVKPRQGGLARWQLDFLRDAPLQRMYYEAIGVELEKRLERERTRTLVSERRSVNVFCLDCGLGILPLLSLKRGGEYLSQRGRGTYIAEGEIGGTRIKGGKKKSPPFKVTTNDSFLNHLIALKESTKKNFSFLYENRIAPKTPKIEWHSFQEPPTPKPQPKPLSDDEWYEFNSRVDMRRRDVRELRPLTLSGEGELRVARLMGLPVGGGSLSEKIPPPGEGDIIEDKMDILVASSFDNGLLGEGILPLLDHMYSLISKNVATSVPLKASLFLMPITLGLQTCSSSRVHIWNTYRYTTQYKTVNLNKEPHCALADPVEVFTFDFRKKSVEKGSGVGFQEMKDITFEVKKDGVFNCLAFWFELELTDGLRVSSGPQYMRTAGWGGEGGQSKETEDLKEKNAKKINAKKNKAKKINAKKINDREAEYKKIAHQFSSKQQKNPQKKYTYYTNAWTQACQMVEEIQVYQNETIKIGAAHDSEKVLFQTYPQSDHQTRRTETPLVDHSWLQLNKRNTELMGEITKTVCSNPKALKEAVERMAKISVDPGQLSDFVINPQDAGWFTLSLFL